MITPEGNYTCDYCQKETGEFYDETGNHVACQDDAAKLATMQSRIKELEAALKASRELAAMAQFELRSAQINWQEDCYFNADDLLTGTIAVLDSVK